MCNLYRSGCERETEADLVAYINELAFDLDHTGAAIEIFLREVRVLVPIT